MRSTWFSRAARAACALTLLAATAVTTVSAGPGPERPGRRRAANLFAVTNAVLNVNRVFCGINNLGELCVDPTNSPVVGGGFWPKGTPDQYIFNSGLQLAGVIPTTAGGGEATFPWAGDTVGAYFFDARGTQVQGDAITLVYNSLDAGDAAVWPAGAYVSDTLLFHPVLTTRADVGAVLRDGSGVAVSQQDLWTRAWDGNPAFLSGRTHPMGILVEERGMAWNFPSGNEDIIYFMFTFTNVTASNCVAYAGLYPLVADAVRRAALQAEICAVGQNFQTRNEAVFSTVAIPNDGYPIGNLYASFSMDPDVGDAGLNYSTAVLPFNMSVAYKSNFLEVNWNYPAEIFGAPFTASPGLVGVKYLKSPLNAAGAEVGLTMFSNTRNAATGFPDPIGVIQLFRYLSGTVSPAAGDNPCTAGVNPLTRKMCFLDQTASDTRFFQASGPFTLNAGESQTIVVAYVHAAPVGAPLLAQPAGQGIGGDLKPGIPAPGDTILATPARIRVIERIAGWVAQGDSNGNGRIDQNEVVSVQRSLLNKALVAQAVFDNRFLLPFAPEAPRFFLIPGNSQVTVVWQASETETVKPGGGDPFFAIASQPTVLDALGNPTANPLYDPNFRQYDVEGYRIYRGRTTSALELLAQFDYAGRTITDFTGGLAYTQDLRGPGRVGGPDGISACAPELGVQDDCPVLFATAPPYTTSVANALVGNVIQVPPGGRVRLANGAVLIVSADTAVTGGGSGYPALSDNGVSFAFTDNTVRNSFTYHYAVTAFDVNSFKSGPSSLESPRITKVVSPRAPSGQETAGGLLPLQLLGGDGSTLTGTLPTIDPVTGIFTGPMPPTDGIEVGLSAFLPQVLVDGSVTVTIDSIIPGASLAGVAGTYYVTAQGAGDPVQASFPILQDAFNEDHSGGTTFPATAISTSKSSRFGGDSTFSLFGSVGITVPGTWLLTSWGRGQANSAPANSDYNGPRWWNGAVNENTPDPNANHCAATLASCPVAPALLPTPLTSSASKTAGRLVNPGDDTVRIFHVTSYNTVANVPTRNLDGVTSYVTRAADIRVYWGAAGAIDSVVDLTHKVRVPFKPGVRASWGIINQQSFTATTAATTPDTRNTVLTWTDIYCVAPVPVRLNQCGGAAQTPAVMQDTARLSSIAMASSSFAGATTVAATGNGFIFYLNGHFFVMQMTALPPAGTQWNARFYAGTVIGAPGGPYSFQSAVRPPAVPGLRAQVAYQASTFDPTVTTAAQLARIHTVPDPYYVTNSLEITPTTKILKFVNMPSQAIVRIYSLSGVLVQVLTGNDPTGGGEVTWNLRNRNNQFVASGVYFYHVETPDGQSKVGRFTVVNFAQ